MIFFKYLQKKEIEKRQKETYARRVQVNRIVDKDTFEEVCAILYKHDPIGLNFGDNSDEYQYEADYVVLRFREAENTKELAIIIKEVFANQFDQKLANNKHALETYDPIASEVWTLLSKPL